ncbi:hypothetical protein HYPDE_33258 [Hyphomicrobium denitrificans 1NES1]|uniref:Uncharacterized protein n=2 Tax=Hyphomicrobium denitrificans TaxID=53399 RepID=N0B472_9HYPH|nr:hypothetical protein HYPDE_33258 [Hyphomicrobium denitrificans 1NES1]
MPATSRRKLLPHYALCLDARMVGTDLQIIHPQRAEIAGADAERLPPIHTDAHNDHCTDWLDKFQDRRNRSPM